MAYFWIRLKLAKISISNINQALPSLKTYQAHLIYLNVSWNNLYYREYYRYREGL